MADHAAAQADASLSPEVALPGKAIPERPRPFALVWFAVTASLLALVLFLRKPDSLLNPQFWAEDGIAFFLQAYDHGLWWTLTRHTAGYLNTAPRLAAGLAVHFPLRAAPLVFNLAAFLIQMVPALYLLSERMGRWIPDRRLRVVAAFLYIAVPNSYETYAILTNCQWNLALVGLLLLTIDPPQRRWGKAGDLLLLALFSCTGPFAIMLLPLALMNLFQHRHGARQAWFATQAAVMAAGAASQIYFLFVGERHSPLVGAWPPLQELLQILSLHIPYNSLLGIRGTIEHAPALTLAAHLAGLALVVLLALFVLHRRHRPLAWLLYLAGITVCSSLFLTTSPLKEWLWPDFGSRYYTFASLFVLYSIMLLCIQGGRLRPLGAFLALPVLFVAIPGDFAHPGEYTEPRRPDTHYADQIAVFETLPAGTSYYIPTQPEGWGGFELRKKTAAREASPLEGLRLAATKPTFFLDEPSPVTIHTGGTESYILFSGWAVDTSAKDLAGAVWLEIDGKLFPAVTGRENRLAELLLRDERYRNSGFYRVVPVSELGFGQHRLSMVVLTHDRTAYQRIPWRFFTVRSLNPPLPQP